MIVLGIDPGASAGVAVVEVSDDSITVLNTYPIKLIPASRKGEKVAGGRRLQDFIDQLLKVFIDHQPDMICCEEPFIKFRNASKSMNRLLACVDIAAHLFRKDTKVVLINPSVVKKAISGNGRIDKEPLAVVLQSKVTNPDMIQRLIEDKQFDQTDSVAIALAGYMTGGV